MVDARKRVAEEGNDEQENDADYEEYVPLRKRRQLEQERKLRVLNKYVLLPHNHRRRRRRQHIRCWHTLFVKTYRSFVHW